jgi:uncharacterized protein YqeY
MTILQQIESKALAARKAKDTVAKNLLITLLGELETKAKRGGEEVTDTLVISTVKKFMDSATDTLKHVAGVNAESEEQCKQELDILKHFLPDQLTESQIESAITMADVKSLGEAMGFLKKSFAGQYDGALASKVAKRLFQ